MDMFTREVYCIAMKIKNNDSVLRAFKLSDKPAVIISDSDSTFYQKKINNF